jgi:hypothetical protein
MSELFAVAGVSTRDNGVASAFQLKTPTIRIAAIAKATGVDLRIKILLGCATGLCMSTLAKPYSFNLDFPRCENVKLVMEAASKIYESLEFTEQAAHGLRQYVEWKARAWRGSSRRNRNYPQRRRWPSCTSPSTTDLSVGP